MKKIFRLSAMVAMLSMMATVSVATSCSDDDDNDPSVVDTVKNDTATGDTTKPVDKDTTPNIPVDENTFSITVGGTAAAEAGSFISIQDKKVYKASELAEDNKVEIVFDGDKFFSASESKNSLVAENGCAAVIRTVTKNKEYAFTTYGGNNGKSYSGTITITDGEMGAETATCKISVTRK